MDAKALKVDSLQLLDNLNLLNNDIPTRAAILLFHHKPEKWIHREDFMITFHAGKTVQTTNQTPVQTTIHTNDDRSNFTDRDIVILQFIKKHPDYSQRKMATSLNMSLGNIKYYLDKFRKFGVIERVGSSYKGYWKILIDF